MNTPTLAPFFALTSLHALMISALGLRVSMRRLALGGVTFGDAADDRLMRLIRIHGNFTEYAAMQVLAVLAVCLAGLPPALGWGLAAVFALVRLLHAWSLGHDSRTAARGGSMAAQHLAFTVAALALVWMLVA